MNYKFKARKVTIAESNDATAHLCLLYVTVLSMRVLILRNLELYLLRESDYSISIKSITFSKIDDQIYTNFIFFIIRIFLKLVQQINT